MHFFDSDSVVGLRYSERAIWNNSWRLKIFLLQCNCKRYRINHYEFC